MKNDAFGSTLAVIQSGAGEHPFNLPPANTLRNSNGDETAASSMLGSMAQFTLAATASPALSNAIRRNSR